MRLHSRTRTTVRTPTRHSNDTATVIRVVVRNLTLVTGLNKVNLTANVIAAESTCVCVRVCVCVCVCVCMCAQSLTLLSF
jgi:hypothetical protein